MLENSSDGAPAPLTTGGQHLKLEFERLQRENNMMTLLCTHLLYERAQETELRIAFEGLVAERHGNFHDAMIDYRDCGNQVCVNARLILKGARGQEITLDQFAVEVMANFIIKFSSVIDETSGKMRYIRAALEQRPVTNTTNLD